MEVIRCFGAKEGSCAEFRDPLNKTRQPKLFASKCDVNCIPSPSTTFKHENISYMPIFQSFQHGIRDLLFSNNSQICLLVAACFLDLQYEF